MSDISYKDVIKHYESVETRLALLEVSLHYYNEQRWQRIDKLIEKIEDKINEMK